MILPRHDPFAAARAGMVARQLVPRGIAEAAVLAAMGEVPQNLFVPEAPSGHQG